ncbi:hypothetical protein BRADI_3g08164v3 [Brachypodium distachyon]|uniref:Uncharacterized protein n=1 Tax=Brachypodium distachyon TaxID=15368 RepID=A0A2K2CVX9_BRADI|nr:hypothetical protein BRADI_3g08164v3 [Brachypodium distachyon]
MLFDPLPARLSSPSSTLARTVLLLQHSRSIDRSRGTSSVAYGEDWQHRQSGAAAAAAHRRRRRLRGSPLPPNAFTLSRTQSSSARPGTSCVHPATGISQMPLLLRRATAASSSPPGTPAAWPWSASWVPSAWPAPTPGTPAAAAAPSPSRTTRRRSTRGRASASACRRSCPWADGPLRRRGLGDGPARRRPRPEAGRPPRRRRRCHLRLLLDLSV